jgi:hypothetical protein
LEYYADAAPEALDNLEPEQRHHIYKMGRFEALAFADGSIELTGPLVPDLIKLCKTEPSSTSSPRRSMRVTSSLWSEGQAASPTERCKG